MTDRPLAWPASSSTTFFFFLLNYIVFVELFFFPIHSYIENLQTDFTQVKNFQNYIGNEWGLAGKERTSCKAAVSTSNAYSKKKNYSK